MAIGVSYRGHTISASDVGELQRQMDGFRDRSGVRAAETVGRVFGTPKTSPHKLEPMQAPMRRKSPPPPAQEPFDPVDGPLVGVEGNDSLEPDGHSRIVGSKGGWRLEMSRTEIEVKPSLELQCNEVRIVKLAYYVIFSEKGLAVGRTPEHKVWEKSFYALADGGKSNGQFAVRAVTNESGHITDLLFGKEADLGGDDIAEIADREGVVRALCSPCPSVA